MTTVKTKMKAREIDPGLVARFADELAGWRRAGCPGTGFYAGFKPRVTKAARACGVSFSELFTLVHRDAEAILTAAAKMTA